MNGEVKFFVKFQKNIYFRFYLIIIFFFFFLGGGVGSGGGGGKGVGGRVRGGSGK